MTLERLYVFPINAPLTAAKRRAINDNLEKNAHRFPRAMAYKWLKRGDERFLRVVVEPVTIEIVFSGDRIEVFGAAPLWARLLFTKARREQVGAWLEQGLVGTGFVV